MAQQAKSKVKPKPAGSTKVRPPPAPSRVTVADIDDLLDEIDAVLEHNAEEFVRKYVQKGGE